MIAFVLSVSCFVSFVLIREKEFVENNTFIQRLREKMNERKRKRPFVTLTFAQSVDGRLTLRRGRIDR